MKRSPQLSAWIPTTEAAQLLKMPEAEAICKMQRHGIQNTLRRIERTDIIVHEWNRRQVVTLSEIQAMKLQETSIR